MITRKPVYKASRCTHTRCLYVLFSSFVARKLKCDGQTPWCGNCHRRKLPCKYALYPRRRGPGKAPKGSKKLQAKKDDSQAASAGRSSQPSTSSGVSAGTDLQTPRPRPSLDPLPVYQLVAPVEPVPDTRLSMLGTMAMETHPPPTYHASFDPHPPQPPLPPPPMPSIHQPGPAGYIQQQYQYPESVNPTAGQQPPAPVPVSSPQTTQYPERTDTDPTFETESSRAYSDVHRPASAMSQMSQHLQYPMQPEDQHVSEGGMSEAWESAPPRPAPTDVSRTGRDDDNEETSSRELYELYDEQRRPGPDPPAPADRESS